MDKLFISCPMKGRKREDIEYSIQKMKNIAEAYVGEPLEVIKSYVPNQNYQGKPIKCLGEAIKKMQDADYFIGVEYSDNNNGCRIERDVARSYIPYNNIMLINTYKILTAQEIEDEERRAGLTYCGECSPR